jgi:hypothetical protein
MSPLVIPGLAKIIRLFGGNTFKPKETMFFVNILKSAIKERKKTKERKNDLIDLMLAAMNEEKEDINRVMREMKIRIFLDQLSGAKSKALAVIIPAQFYPKLLPLVSCF